MRPMSNGSSSIRSLVVLLFALPSVVAAQEPASIPAEDAESAAASLSTVPPRPAMGWVLESNQAAIPAEFGPAALESSGAGASPAVALDGAGNIDGAGLLGGLPSGTLLGSYALKSADQATLQAGTTVILLCGRLNSWLRYPNGALLPTAAPAKSFSVTKPREWGVNLISAVSPFAVVVGGQWKYAAAPPVPASYSSFGTEFKFPALGSNNQVCVWALYDTSVEGSTARPEISVAYNDGPAGTPVKLTAPVAKGANPLEVVFNSVGADLGTLFIWQGSAAEALFRQSLRATYWNGGLRKSIQSGFQTEPWSGLDVTLLDPRPIVLGGDAQDNVWAVSYPGFVRTSPFAHYSVTVSPFTKFLAVRYQLGNTPYHPSEYSVSFELDGKYLGYDQPWQFGTNYRSIPLPQDGRSHTVELINGYTRNNGNYAAPTEGAFGGGGFIDAVAVPPGHTLKVNRPAPRSVALVVSHSIAVADEAAIVPYQGQGPQSSVAWPVMARAANAFGTSSVVDESYAGELLANDCWTQSDCDAYIAAIKKAQPEIKLGFVARLINDFAHGHAFYSECLPEYEAVMRRLIASWNSELPGVPLYIGSDTRKAVPNEARIDHCTPSHTQAYWREGIESTVKTYIANHQADWLHFVDMTEWVPQSELLPDGVHPTVEGQVKICQAVAEYFDQQVTCAVPQ
jgi:hypothetical protein